MKELRTLALYTDNPDDQTEYAFIPRPGVEALLHHGEVSSLAWMFACDTADEANGLLSMLFDKLNTGIRGSIKGKRRKENPREVLYVAEEVCNSWLILVCMLDDGEDPQQGIQDYVDYRAASNPN